MQSSAGKAPLTRSRDLDVGSLDLPTMTDGTIPTVMEGVNMKVLVLEPRANGHHGPYAQWMVEGLLNHGCDVTLLTYKESLKHEAMQQLVDRARSTSGNRLKVFGIHERRKPETLRDRPGGLIFRELAYYFMFRRWFRRQQNNEGVMVDAIFLPYADYCLYAIGLLGSPFDECPWSGVAMRPSFHYQDAGVIAPRPSMARIKRVLFYRIFRIGRIRRLLVVDEPLAQTLAKKVEVPKEKWQFLPEPVELGELPVRTSARQKFDLSPDRKTLLVYGAITMRKGIKELLEALLEPDFPSEIDVLLAGKHSEEVRNLLRKPSVQELVITSRIRSIDRFIRDEEQGALYSAADMVWLGYRKHYTASGVLLQAARAGKPVITANLGLVAWQTKRYGLGRVVDPSNPGAVAAAIKALESEMKFQFHTATAPRQGPITANTLLESQQIVINAVTDSASYGRN